jgi:D-cysteine desulfhydrase
MRVTTATPVQLLEPLSRPGAALWVKRDDLTDPVYGGNKARKLEPILAEAAERGARRLVTVGPVGSHHVLACGVFGRARGMAVEAVVVPQRATQHVVDNLRADLAVGIDLLPASSYGHAAVRVAWRLACHVAGPGPGPGPGPGRRGAFYVPPGGSSRAGVRGYVDGARELAQQVRAGEMPEPDLVVVTLGSGGTAAGLAAGFAAEGMRTRVLAVTVTEPAWAVEWAAMSMARAAAGRSRKGAAREAAARLEVDRRYLGQGYGQGTPEGERATARAAEIGLVLDETYTAKTFAAALDRVAEGRLPTILYWHTLSSADLGPLLAGAPPLDAIDPRLRRLLL